MKAYDLVEEERDGKRYQRLVDGGQVELSNFKTSAHGVHGRVSVTNISCSDQTQEDNRLRKDSRFLILFAKAVHVFLSSENFLLSS